MRNVFDLKNMKSVFNLRNKKKNEIFEILRFLNFRRNKDEIC